MDKYKAINFSLWWHIFKKILNVCFFPWEKGKYGGFKTEEVVLSNSSFIYIIWKYYKFKFIKVKKTLEKANGLVRALFLLKVYNTNLILRKMFKKWEISQ